ncbi:MAG: PQQ-binding-like beta-propeller repeat protein [Candidatus Bathyarchaeota archaeon]|nr:PQQ-binding-like beta-propeller repeat protein [Candidatus Bathyarchaeota archaeon]
MRKAILAVAIASVFLLSNLLVFSCNDAPAPVIAAATNDEAASSKWLWNFTVFNTTEHTQDLTVGTPKVANGLAYVRSTEGYTIPGEKYHDHFGFGPPVHRLVCVHALNLSSGEEIWNFTGGFSYTDDARKVVDDKVYLSDDSGLYALDGATGAQKWNFTSDGYIRWYVVSGGIVYLTVETTQQLVYALDAASGHQLWKWTTSYNPGLPSPAIGDDAIYLGTTYKPYQYYAISIKDGNELWSSDVNGRVADSAFSDSAVYFYSSTLGQTYDAPTVTYLNALNTQNGGALWKLPIGYSSTGTPIVDGDVVYAVGREGAYKKTDAWRFEWGNSSIYALDASSGSPIWTYSANVDFTPLTLRDGIVYFSENGTFKALNAVDGTQLWSINTNTNASSTLVDGVFYYCSNNRLYALDAANGNSLGNVSVDSDMTFKTVTQGVAFFKANNTIHALSVPWSEQPSTTPSATSKIESPLNAEPIDQTLLLIAASLLFVTFVAIVLVKRVNRLRKIPLQKGSPS